MDFWYVFCAEIHTENMITVPLAVLLDVRFGPVT